MERTPKEFENRLIYIKLQKIIIIIIFFFEFFLHQR